MALHMPSIPSFYLDLELPVQERESILQQQYKDMDSVLEFFANISLPSPKPLKTNRIFSCIGFNNRVFDLIGYIASRPLQILKDTFRCCLKSRTNKHECEPAEFTELNPPKEIEEKLARSREDYHTNIIGLGVIAPTTTIAAPFITFPAISQLATIISGLTILTAAGTMTYFFSGNFGTDRVESTIWLSHDFSNLTLHLKERFENGSQQKKNELISQCVKIANNWKSLYHALEKVGLKENSIKVILGPFSRCIHRIQMTHYELQDSDLESQSWSASSVENHSQ